LGSVQFHFDRFFGCHGFIAGKGKGNGLKGVPIGGADLAAVTGDYRFDKGAVAEKTCLSFLSIDSGIVGGTPQTTVAFDHKTVIARLDGRRLAVDLEVVEDFSDYWGGFLVFPTKNTTESDSYFGESDYKRCKSIVEEIMLTISQNSKIINRHANPKLAGSEQNLEMNPVTNKRFLPDTDFFKVGTDGVKPEYITADLQADAISKHIDMLMNFFYILTKTPPQAYGLDISGNMSGESLRKIFIAALSKVDDIKQVSFTSVIQNVVECALALNLTPVKSVHVAWGEPIPADYSELVNIENSRVAAGTQSKFTTIMTLDNVSEDDAKAELERIEREKVKPGLESEEDRV